MKHKAGIIGYGNMGSWHAENVNSRIEDLEVVCVYDIDPERQKLAEENGLKVILQPRNYWQVILIL